MAVKGKTPESMPADMRGVYQRLAKLVSSPKADGLYNGLSQSRSGKIISADVARLLAPEFRTWSGRVRHTPATGAPAGAYAHDRLMRELQDRGGRRTLLITAGGAGAGKTSQLRAQTAIADLIFDNQLREVSRAREILKTALRHDWQVEIVYVHRPFADVVRAVIERSQRTGRWNWLYELPAAHIEAQRTVVTLWREFGDSTPVDAIYNASNGFEQQPAGSRIDIQELDPGGRYHYADGKELAKHVASILKAAVREGAVCKEVARIIGHYR